MAEIAKSGTPSLATVLPDPGACKLPALVAGENLAAGDACYIKNDGMIYRSTGAATGQAARVMGFAPQKTNAGEVVTLYYHVNFRYGATLTPGTPYYVSGTNPGGLADAASTGGTGIVGFAVDATRIYVRQSGY
jgi:hypothetical protein